MDLFEIPVFFLLSFGGFLMLMAILWFAKFRPGRSDSNTKS